MSVPSPACTVNGTLAPPAVAVGAGSTPTIALANPTGALFWGLLAIGADEVTNLATINASLAINQITKQATFAAPGVGGSGIIFQSTVGIGTASQQGSGRDAGGNIVAAFTTTFKVNVLTAAGLSVIATNEVVEENQAAGWIAEQNAVIRRASLGGFSPPFRANSNTTLSTAFTLVYADTSGGAITVSFPSGMTIANDGLVIRVKDAKGTWATNNLTMAANTGQKVENPASLGTYSAVNGSQVLNVKGGSVDFQWDNTQGIWLVV